MRSYEKKGMTADFMHELDLLHLRNCKQDMHMIYGRQILLCEKIKIKFKGTYLRDHSHMTSDVLGVFIGLPT